MAWIKDFNNKLTLALNKLSNDYDNNWLLGAGWLILISTLLFIVYCIALLGFKAGLIFWGGQWYRTVEFMVPTHKWNFFDTEVQYNASSYIVDGFARICNAYLIYQTIQAFRKYGRSSLF